MYFTLDFIMLFDPRSPQLFGPLLLGHDFSLAEIASAPFALRLAIVLPALRPSMQPDAIIDGSRGQGLTRLREWFAAVCARPSCACSLCFPTRSSSQITPA